MTTTKRRRGVGVKKWIIDALKEAAQMGGHKSHTQVANKIWAGKLAPLDINICRRFKSESKYGSQGVSMREAQWLALKVYAEQRGEGENTSQIANKILVGVIGPIPDNCIDRGKTWAKEREEERAADEKESPTPKSKKKAAKKARKQSDEDDKEKTEDVPDSGREPFSKRSKKKLSQGHEREPSKTPEQKEITPDAEYFGGIFSL